MNFPEHLKYTKEHEWIHIKGGKGTIGITEYAQSELGDVVFVELPAVGTQIKQGDSFGSVEAVKAVSDLYAPVSGEIVEVNSALDKTPELVNKEPYQGGWMIKVALSGDADPGGLLSSEQYKALIGK